MQRIPPAAATVSLILTLIWRWGVVELYKVNLHWSVRYTVAQTTTSLRPGKALNYDSDLLVALTVDQIDRRLSAPLRSRQSSHHDLHLLTKGQYSHGADS